MPFCLVRAERWGFWRFSLVSVTLGSGSCCNMLAASFALSWWSQRIWETWLWLLRDSPPSWPWRNPRTPKGVLYLGEEQGVCWGNRKLIDPSAWLLPQDLGHSLFPTIPSLLKLAGWLRTEKKGHRTYQLSWEFVGQPEDTAGPAHWN